MKKSKSTQSNGTQLHSVFFDSDCVKTSKKYFCRIISVFFLQGEEEGRWCAEIEEAEARCFSGVRDEAPPGAHGAASLVTSCMFLSNFWTLVVVSIPYRSIETARPVRCARRGAREQFPASGSEAVYSGFPFRGTIIIILIAFTAKDRHCHLYWL